MSCARDPWLLKKNQRHSYNQNDTSYRWKSGAADAVVPPCKADFKVPEAQSYYSDEVSGYLQENAIAHLEDIPRRALCPRCSSSDDDCMEGIFCRGVWKVINWNNMRQPANLPDGIPYSHNHKHTCNTCHVIINIEIIYYISMFMVITYNQCTCAGNVYIYRVCVCTRMYLYCVLEHCT